MTALPVISFDQVRCRVGTRTTLAVDRLHIGAGERVALIGPNGAGKSTLLRCLNGFATPAHGEVMVFDQRLGAGRRSARRLRVLRTGVGHVMQGLHLVQRLSALENVLVGALARVPGWRSWLRIYPQAEIDAARAALQRVGLAARARSRADRLSGGERQKVAIARMLLQRPRLILADEPTASLDPTAAEEICRLLVEAAQGSTLVSVIHNPALLPLLADRVIGLKDGQIAFDRPVGQVDAALLEALYRAAPPAADPAGLLSLPTDARLLSAS